MRTVCGAFCYSQKEFLVILVEPEVWVHPVVDLLP